LERILKEPEIIRTIKIRKLCYFGHVIKREKYEMLRLIIQGKIEGKKGRIKPRITWIKNLKEWTGLTTVELFRATENRGLEHNNI